MLRMSRASALALLSTLLLTLALLAWPVHAGKVITPDKEDTLRGLLEPYALGQVVRDGFVLHNMQIDRHQVVLTLRDEADARSATLTLEPRVPWDATGSESFTFAFAGDEGARAGADALAEAIRIHDHGGIYLELDDPPPASADPPPWPTRERASYLLTIAGLAALVLGLLALARASLGERLRVQDELLAGAIMITALLGVAAYAWICDDATISLRYAWNLASGRGLVFNVGERVQGFTNPLWTLALALGALWGSHHVWAIQLGLICSLGALAGLWSCARRLGLQAGGFAAIVVLAFACQPVLAFSTSGLENAATHMLVVACLAATLAERPRAVMIFASLALLERLDTAPLLVPLVALAWTRAGASPRERFLACRSGMLVAGVLLGSWLGFATLYYGYPLPNTWYAKGGLHVGLGLRYLGDFIALRPSSAIVLLGSPVATLAWSRSPALRAAAIGVLAQLAYVSTIGGDYMHGRFFTAAHVIACVGLVGCVAALEWKRKLGHAVVAMLALGAIINLVRPARSSGGMIVVERERDFAVWRRGLVEVVPPEQGDPALAGVAISNHLIGQVFGSDQGIVWIDGYGLTDPYIARCPPLEVDPRPGHAKRLIPRAYLRARGDVRQLPRGRARLDARDPSLGPELADMRADPRWPSEELRRRYEELELLTRGPLLAPARLRLIPAYVLGRFTLPPVDPRDGFDVLAADD